MKAQRGPAFHFPLILFTDFSSFLCSGGFSARRLRLPVRRFDRRRPTTRKPITAQVRPVASGPLQLLLEGTIKQKASLQFCCVAFFIFKCVLYHFKGSGLVTFKRYPALIQIITCSYFSSFS